MKMVEVVTQKKYTGEVAHEFYRIVKVYDSETTPRKGSRPRQHHDSLDSPLHSPPSYPTSSTVAGASRPMPETRLPRHGQGKGKGFIKKTLKAILGMRVANNKAIREHQHYMQEKFLGSRFRGRR